jgi:hypothetical protein
MKLNLRQVYPLNSFEDNIKTWTPDLPVLPLYARCLENAQ